MFQLGFAFTDCSLTLLMKNRHYTQNPPPPSGYQSVSDTGNLVMAVGKVEFEILQSERTHRTTRSWPLQAASNRSVSGLDSFTASFRVIMRRICPVSPRFLMNWRRSSSSENSCDRMTYSPMSSAHCWYAS